MDVIWHDHGRVKIKFGAVLFHTALENNISGSRRKLPATIGDECDEERVGVFLIVRQTTAVLIFRLHSAVGPSGRTTGSKTRSHINLA